MSARTEVRPPKSKVVYHTPIQENVKPITKAGRHHPGTSSADEAAALENQANRSADIANSGSASLEYGDRQLIKCREAVRLGLEANGSRSLYRSLIDVDERSAILAVERYRCRGFVVIAGIIWIERSDRRRALQESQTSALRALR
jgi:hypothetical protein